MVVLLELEVRLEDWWVYEGGLLMMVDLFLLEEVVVGRVWDECGGGLVRH